MYVHPRTGIENHFPGLVPDLTEEGDVVATIEFGITTITEVVQVKRQQGSIQRPILDQLRGALPYHKALRGTIITLGKFSQGCIDGALFAGAAPIGLIDGEKLLDLLVMHEIGVTHREVTLHELNSAYFATSLESDDAPIRDGAMNDVLKA